MTVFERSEWLPLDTARLHMTVFDPSLESDYTKILEMYNLPSIVELWGNRGLNTPADIDALVPKRVLPAFICKKLPPSKPPPSHCWILVYLKDSADFIGFVGFHFDHEDPEWPAELGYNIKPEYQGCGYATEGVKAVVSWCDEVLGLEALAASASINNFASCRVAEKAGGVNRGTKRQARWERKDSSGTVVYEWMFGERGKSE